MVLPLLFALFVLDKDITKDYLEDCLTRAHNGDPTPGWSFWVATSSYTDMPAPSQREKPDKEGIEPPLPAEWSSLWIGKSVEDCAKWLQQMHTCNGPEYYLHTNVRRDYFAAMDKFSKEDDTILVCRVVKTGDEELRVDYFPQKTDEVQMQMWTNEGSMLDNKAEAYQATARKEGKLGRSRFQPGRSPGS